MNKTIRFSLISLAIAASFGAQAAPGNNGGGKGGCGVGQQTNGCGGAGGAGGVGIGGQVLNSGNSNNTNVNSNQNNNTNTNANSNSNINQNTNQNTNTNVNNVNNTQGQQQGQAQGQKQGQNQNQVANGGNASQSQRTDNSNNASQSVTVQGDSYEAPRIPAATAYAAGLTAANGTCMGSSSVGGQGMSFGFSLGSTWNDSGCNRRYNAHTLVLLGKASAGVALMCQDPEVKAAMEAAGESCPVAKKAEVASSTSSEQTLASSGGIRPEETDPIKRYRFGLPALN